MKRFFVLLMAVALVLTGCAQSPDGQDAKPHPIEKVDGDIGGMQEPEDAEKVEFVEHVDGDTSKFKIDGKVETVRYLLIDTPETKHPKLGEQPLGKEASEFVKNMLENAREIKLEYDVEKRDKYYRVLAYVWVDGKNVQEQVLIEGLARVGYVYESKRHLQEFREAEQAAKEGKEGIWQCPGYVTDEGYDPSKWCKGGGTKTPPKKSKTGLKYDPFGPDRDCSDFDTQAEAQAFFEAAGGPEKDPHRLEGNDKDGVVCESLP